MQLTFNSRSIGRIIGLDELPRLAQSELRELHAELLMAVQAMDEKVQESKELEHISGISADEDWIHRVKKKRRICVTFAAQVKQAMEATDTSFEAVYRLKLDELLLEELGEDTWQEIKSEAMEFALANRLQAAPAA